MMRAWLLIAIFALGACSRVDDDTAVVERIAPASVTLAVEAQGNLKSAKATSMVVPGQQWSQRQLSWMLADGSWVKQDDVVARFQAPQSKVELATALVDLQRTALARAAKQDELGDSMGKLQVDLSQVIGLLGIAHRYAHATEGALARNTILDAVQDETFLGVKQDSLNWRKGNSNTRGEAELALIDAQRATNDLVAKGKRDDLQSLEIHAPHAGLLVLEPNWAGEKPRVGSSMWAGNNFASLPDVATMEVELALPQTQAQGIKEGMSVELAPLGAPEQKVTAKLSWIAGAAALRGRDSPVKYLSMKAPVPVEAINRYHWVPGQRFVGHIILLHADNVLSVPNVALESSGDNSTVTVVTGAHKEKRSVRLGVRGPSRSEVLDGLKAGEEIVLNAAVEKPGAATVPAASTKASP